MTKPPHVSSATDLNLLFGILALQMDFIDREQLVAAMQAWLSDKNKSLGAILVQQNVLSTPRLILLQALVEEHLKQHKNDPQQSLAAVGPHLADGGTLKSDLEKLADSEVDATLMNVGPDNKPSCDDPYATSAVTATTLAVGLRFRILRPHARGGLGTVYVAFDEELHREVALKEIQDHHANNLNSRARFLLEAEITGRLEHPGIVPVYGLGQYADGRPYYAMRFIKGDSLQDAIDRFHDPKSAPTRSGEYPIRHDPNERNLELRGMLGRLIDVCNAIQYAHDRGVLHRDLKPGNIMLGKYGETLVVDWGLAKPMGSRPEQSSEESSLKPKSLGDSTETLQGSAVGTPAFMSPEQAGGKIDQLGPASDIYSLGATLYCVITGKAPIDLSIAQEKGKADLGTILKKVQRGDFPRPRQIKPDVDPALEAICLRAMALKTSDRYRTPRALASDLEHWLADRPVTAWPEPWSVRARRWVGQHRTLVTSAAVALLLGIVGLTGLNLIQKLAHDDLAQKNQEVRDARDVAEQNRKEEQKAKDEAVEAQRKAVQAQVETAEMLAINTIMLAQTRWNEEQAETANDLLDEVPVQFRARSGGWSFLKHRFEGSYCTLYGHVSPVNAAAFSRDGRHIASASMDRTLQLWDAVTGEHLWTAAKHQSGLTSLAFSPDSSLLASGSWDGTVKIWDVNRRTEFHTFTKHTRDVNNVAFSRDGKRIASASEDGIVMVWDPRNPGDHFTLQAHHMPVRGLAFSPDGKLIATSSDDKTVKIWDADKPGPARNTLTGHEEKIWCLAFSPDGKRLASASDDDTVKVWHVPPTQFKGEKGKDEWHLLFTLKHLGDVRCVSFSPDGLSLASASFDKTIKLWDAVKGMPLKTYLGHTSTVLGVSFSPDGQRLVSAGADKTIKLWDARVDQELLSVHQKSPTCASLSHDGRRLATSSEDHSVKIWDSLTGQVVFICEEHKLPVRGVAFRADGERLASCGDDHAVVMWNGLTGAKVWSQQYGDKVRCVAFSPDGKFLAAAGADHSIIICDASTGKQLKKLTGHTDEVSSVAFGPSGQRLASASFDKTIKIWDLRTERAISTLQGHNDRVTSLAFSPDGDRLVSGSNDQMLKVWDVIKGQELSSVTADKAVLSVAFSPDGQRLVSAGKTGTIKVWDAITHIELLSFLGHPRGVQSVSFSSDGQTLVSAGDDHTCKLWDVHLGKEPLVLRGHKGGLRSVAFNPAKQLLATAGLDGTVKMWRAGTGEEVLPLMFKEHKDKVFCVQFNRAGDILATAGEDKIVRLWNAQTGADKHSLIGHTGSVCSVAFSPDGKRLASAAADNTVCLWDSESGRLVRPPLTGHTNEVHSVAFSVDGKQLASGSYDKSVKLWDVQTGALEYSFENQHRNWVTSVKYGSDAKWIVSRDVDEKILVWNQDKVRTETKDPDPWPFPANLVDGGNKLILTTAKRIQIIDLRAPTDQELAYRQAMSRLKPWWHEERAKRHQAESDWFAASFHWSWAVQADAASAEKWHSLDQACLRLKNWQHAQRLCTRLLKEQPAFEVPLPARSPWLNIVLAVAHHRLGHGDRAAKYLGEAVLPNEVSADQRELFENVRGAAQRELGVGKK
jgi:WD40 repeat protein/serine/threonine protein kinase